MAGDSIHFRNGPNRWWLAGLIVLLLPVAAGVVGRLNAERHLRVAADAVEAAERHQREARRAAHLMADYAPRYRALVAEGGIGGGSPAAWAGALHRLGEGAGEGRVGYRIEPPAPFSPPGGAMEGVSGAALSLRLLLRHEGELVEHLARLRGGGVGRLRVEGCELSRREGVALGGPLLAVNCDLRWLMVSGEEGA